MIQGILKKRFAPARAESYKKSVKQQKRKRKKKKKEKK
jgi:hypothetical protein